uniref:C-type lectin domain-containing protein n=1 Tax=Sphaeramia orbicularis TaxID=375764 RepID=A0A673A5Q3_9TELE
METNLDGLKRIYIFVFHFYGFWQSSGWLLYSGFIPRDYFCFSLIVIEEKKSWEEALEYCREKHAEITSLVSEHEVLLAQKVIQPNSITDPVWIGLCFLGNRWLWVNGDPLEYQAWTMGEEHSQCLEKGRCGALAKGGQWENRDCQERLSFIFFTRNNLHFC